MKILYLLLLPVVLFFKQQTKPSLNASGSDSNNVLTNLKSKKIVIDRSIITNNKLLIVFVKIPGKEVLVRVLRDKWPDEIEYTYNVLRDKDGKIMMISKVPYSESGDWDLTDIHYFDSSERTFAFERRYNSFNECLSENEVAYETNTDYFDISFKSLKRDYKLVDKNGKPLDKQKCSGDNDTEKIQTYPNAASCLKAYHIKL